MSLYVLFLSGLGVRQTPVTENRREEMPLSTDPIRKGPIFSCIHLQNSRQYFFKKNCYMVCFFLQISTYDKYCENMDGFG